MLGSCARLAHDRSHDALKLSNIELPDCVYGIKLRSRLNFQLRSSLE